jgi:hypothetical protein
MVLSGNNFFNEINQLLPEPHIWVQSIAWHDGCQLIFAIWHLTNHNHESCISQLWEVASHLFAGMLSQIRHR